MKQASRGGHVCVPGESFIAVCICFYSHKHRTITGVVRIWRQGSHGVAWEAVAIGLACINFSFDALTNSCVPVLARGKKATTQSYAGFFTHLLSKYSMLDRFFVCLLFVPISASEGASPGSISFLSLNVQALKSKSIALRVDPISKSDQTCLTGKIIHCLMVPGPNAGLTHARQMLCCGATLYTDSMWHACSVRCHLDSS